MAKKCDFCGNHIEISSDEYANIYLNPRAKMLSYHVTCLNAALALGRFKDGRYQQLAEKEEF